MTCLPALLATVVVIAASLLGGCSDSLIGAGDVASTPVSTGDLAAVRATAGAAKGPIGVQLASAALDDGRLSQIRGGFETSSGVVLNFAFQQATFINHSLAENIVVPTITIAPGTGTASVAGALPAGASIPSLNGLGMSAPNTGSTAILGNGTVQTQVSPSAPVIQALVNSGMTSVVSTLGSGGLNNVITNAANNQLVQQVTTLDIGITGLTKLIQQGLPSAVMNRLSGGAQFR